jgi:predicted hotdog family 3-hydroxylacyl-ACP dehydratase
LTELIPHRGASVVLDRMTDFAPPHGQCEIVLDETFPYCIDGRVDAVVGLEMLAQAVSAYVGMTRRSGGGEPRVGYLIGVPRAEFHVDSLPLGVPLRAKVEQVWHEGPAGSFNGQLLAPTGPLVDAQLSVFEPGSVEPGAVQQGASAPERAT